MPLLRGIARTAIIAGTATAVSNNVSRRQYNRWEAQSEEQQQQQPEQQVVSNGNDGDVYDQLERLGKLKEQGIITQAEFDAKKKQLLGI